MQIFELIESIAATSSTNEKKAIVERNKTNEVLKAAFLLAENPRFNYYIKNEDPDLIKSAPKNGRDIVFSDFLIFEKFVKREVTGNAARDAFVEALAPLNAGARTIMQRILNRDLRCGMGTTIANKIWKDLIPEYPVLLASKGDKKGMDYLEKVGGPFIVQKKCDGGRVNVVVDSLGNVSYRSRSGSTLELHGYFDSQFSGFRDVVFDGELLVKTDSGIADRKTGNGLYTKAVRGTLSTKEAAMMCMEVWDIIAMNAFQNGIGQTPYSKRMEQLLEYSKKFNPNVVQVVETVIVDKLEDAHKFYEKMRAQGEEGCIIKVASGVWEDKRSKNIVKMKAEETADLIVIAVEEGSGKYKGLIGNLVCQTRCGKLVVGVGSGFTDADRKLPPEHFISKIVEVGYNEIITAKNRDVKSLFLPIFKQVRFDKTVANSLEELK